MSKCTLATYLPLYISSLSSLDFIASTCLTVIKFAHSGSYVLNTALNVALLMKSRIYAYLASTIFGAVLSRVILLNNFGQTTVMRAAEYM